MTEPMSDGVDRAAAALTAERATTLERLAAAESNFQHIVTAAQAVATDDEHDPEGVGLALERAHIVAAMAQSREHLARIDEAEGRLARGEYGCCTVCGAPIPAARLQARPTAATCVGCAGR